MKGQSKSGRESLQIVLWTESSSSSTMIMASGRVVMHGPCMWTCRGRNPESNLMKLVRSVFKSHMIASTVLFASLFWPPLSHKWTWTSGQVHGLQKAGPTSQEPRRGGLAEHGGAVQSLCHEFAGR